jgi:hypothetical protein
MHRMRTRICERTSSRDIGTRIDPRRCKNSACKKTFAPARPWQLFCSSGCHDLYWKELREKARQLDKYGEVGSDDEGAEGTASNSKECPY